MLGQGGGILDHIVGMRHLQLVLEGLDATGNDPPRSGRQDIQQIFCVGAEEHQVHGGAVIRHPHFIGLAFHPWREMIEHADFDSGDAAGFCGNQPGAVRTVHHPNRQVENQVHQLWARHLGDQFFQLGAHPGQGADFGKKREQNRRPHGR